MHPPESYSLLSFLFVHLSLKMACINTICYYLQESPSGRRKALATSSINMKQYASPMPTQTDVKLKFKPLSKKVVSATLQFSLSCIFLREGKAT